MGLVIGIGQTRPEPVFDQFYGIEFDVRVSNPNVARIGKMELHQLLPIQSKMRRCILTDDGEVAYYLNAYNSEKKEDGEPANLDGTDGQVMVEIPSFYYKFEEDGNKRRVLISEREIPGFKQWKKCYVSAYEASIQRSTQKLSSVVNASVDYRGGGDDASRDNTFKTLLGKPASNFTLEEARRYARNRGSVNWNCYVYSIHKMLCWLFVVEYATLNTQSEYTSERVGGYMSGGLGTGISGFGSFNVFNGNPCFNCGITNSLGNSSGVVASKIFLNEGQTNYHTARVSSYRGVENPFGHIWKFMDGIHMELYNGKVKLYTSNRPDLFGLNYSGNYRLAAEFPQHEVLGYIREVAFGEEGEIVAKAIGGSSTTYFCDESYPSAVGAMATGGEGSMNSERVGLFLTRTIENRGRFLFAGTRLCYLT